MKKRGYLFLVCFILAILVPSINAEITLSGPEQTTFNIGDQLTIKGAIQEATDHTGFLKFELDCGATEVLTTRALTLRANVKKEFQEAFALPQALTGNCKIKATFEDEDRVAEAASTPFTVTSALNAPLTLDKDSVQLGDSLSITGAITKMNGQAIDGVARVSFQQRKTLVAQDIVKITKGKFSYTYETKESPAGAYEITVDITDINNNKQTVTFKNVLIRGNIDLAITFNDHEFLPGEKVRIDGTAKTSDTKITKGKAYITLDNKREEATILLGVLKHTITLPKDSKTGEHTVTIDVEDPYGNKETQQFTITIAAVPTRLELLVNQESFAPEKQVVLKPTLYDQGNDIINTDVAMDVYDAEKDEVFTDTIKSTEQTMFTLPPSAAPGAWKVKATALGVDALTSFTVEEKKGMQITQEGSALLFTNTGNIPIKEPITITLTNKNDPANSVTKEKKVALQVGQSKLIDLAYLAGQGNYAVQVADKTFEIDIAKRKWSILPYLSIILGLAILFLITKLVMRYKPRFSQRRKDRHVQDMHVHKQKHHLQQQPVHRQRSEEWYEEKLKRDLAERREARRQKIHFSFKKRKDEYVMEIQKKRARTEQPSSWTRESPRQEQHETFTNTDFSDPWKTQEEPEKKREEEKPKKGLFGLFD